MKKVLIFIMVLLLIGCQESVDIVEEEIAKGVRVSEITSHVYVDEEIYVGYVKSAGLLKQAFEVEGKIDAVHVSVGDEVKAGDVIASIDTEGLQYALNAASAEMSAANAQYRKAIESSGYAKDLYEDTKQLYEAGVSSKAEFDKVKLNYDVAMNEVNSARELVNQAVTNVDVKTYMMDQSELFASKDGIVVDVLYEVGELIPSGYPVVVIRDELPVVSFGITQDDLKFIKLDDTLSLICDETTSKGQIISINQTPDTVTQTYEVEVSLSKDLPLGAIVSIGVPTEDYLGTKIPLGAVRSDGEDFVFVVVEDRVVRTAIQVVAIFNQEVIVTGIPDDSLLVVEGIMGLTTGDLVKIVEDES